MKAISLWQPWASAIACGSKRIETRSWSTSHRGPLAIHAAKRFSFDEMCYFASCWNWTGAMWKAEFGMQPGLTPEARDAPLKTKLPLGAVVATCRLVACKPTDSFTQSELDSPRIPGGAEAAHLYAWTERQMGDFSLGRFGWVLDEIKPLPRPIPFRGARRLFDVPDNVLFAEAA